MFPEIAQTVARLGEAVIFRVFGNFANPALASWHEIARKHGLEIAVQTPGHAGDGAADLAVVIQAMDILHDKVVDAFCVVSMDSDFVPLARRIRAGGVPVFGIGRPDTCARWQNACSQFFVVGEDIEQPSKTAWSEHQRSTLLAFLRELAEYHSDRDGSLLPSFVSGQIRQRHPEIAARLGGAGHFLRNLDAAGAVDVVGSGSAKRLRPRAAELKLVASSD